MSVDDRDAVQFVAKLLGSVGAGCLCDAEVAFRGVGSSALPLIGLRDVCDPKATWNHSRFEFMDARKAAGTAAAQRRGQFCACAAPPVLHVAFLSARSQAKIARSIGGFGPRFVACRCIAASQAIAVSSISAPILALEPHRSQGKIRGGAHSVVTIDDCLRCGGDAYGTQTLGAKGLRAPAAHRESPHVARGPRMICVACGLAGNLCLRSAPSLEGRLTSVAFRPLALLGAVA